MASFSVCVTDRCRCTVIVLAGDLDVFSAPLLRQALLDALARGRARLVVDAANLESCDSAGLLTLIEGHYCAIAAGGHLSLAYVHGALKHLVEASGQVGACPLDVDVATQE